MGRARKITFQQIMILQELFDLRGIKIIADQNKFMSGVVGTRIRFFHDLTLEEASFVIDKLKDMGEK